MAYTINYSNGTKTALSVANGAVDTTTNIGLVGQSYKNYGEVIAEDLLHLLENFANGVAPTKPVEGQIWYDSSAKLLKYFDNTIDNSGNWKPIASMSVTSSQPTGDGENEGHFWINTETNEFNVYYNGEWITINQIGSDTSVKNRQRLARDGSQRNTLEYIVGSEIVAIVSAGPDEDGFGYWRPANAGPTAEYLEDGTTLLDTQFGQIYKGFNLNNANTGEYIYHGTATTARYADLAERYHADDNYDAGTVVKLGGINEVTITDSEYCSQIFGVVSSKPGVRMNEAAGPSDTHPYIALAGRVPVKVTGQVRKGDRLVTSSIDGHAMSGGENGVNWEMVIGRALEDKLDDAIGMIEVAVGNK